MVLSLWLPEQFIGNVQPMLAENTHTYIYIHWTLMCVYKGKDATRLFSLLLPVFLILYCSHSLYVPRVWLLLLCLHIRVLSKVLRFILHCFQSFSLTQYIFFHPFFSTVGLKKNFPLFFILLSLYHITNL